jgi:hypothetical protein
MKYETILMKLTMPLLLTGLMTASAYACEIQYTQESVLIKKAEVATFGDLKVKLVSTEGLIPTFKIKAPSFEKNNVPIPKDTPYVVRACGHDVSVVFEGWVGVVGGDAVKVKIVNSDM